MKGQQYKNYIVILVVVILVVQGYYIIGYKPKNSELYQAIQFSKDYNQAQKLILEGYEENFSKEVYEGIINASSSPNSVNQFTVFQYDNESYIIETTPGTMKLEILRVAKLPKKMKDYLDELTEENKVCITLTVLILKVEI